MKPRCRECGTFADNKVYERRNGRTKVYWVCEDHYTDAMAADELVRIAESLGLDGARWENEGGR